MQLPFEVHSVLLRRIIFIVIIGWMSTYSIYTSYYRAYAVDTYSRFIDHRQGRSMFFNPWQYRVLCPVLIDGIYQTMDMTIFKVINIRGINVELQGNTTDKNANTLKLMTQLKDPDFVKHTIVFLGFRFVENIIIFLLAYFYLSVFVVNIGLRWLALGFIALSLGNTVVDSDLTFNTYMDLIIYLSVGLVIIKNMNYWWIIVLTIVGAFNRESSIFIPVIFFFSKSSWSNWPSFRKIFFKEKEVFWIATLASVLYLVIFIGIRFYYGYRPLETWRVGPGWPMLKLNLFSASALKTYMEFFGLFAFLPIWAIAVLKNTDIRLKILFYALVPVWFGLHLYSAIGFQTRLFLVPTVLVIIPIVFANIDRSVSHLQLKSN